jgi:hypothetical protein
VWSSRCFGLYAGAKIFTAPANFILDKNGEIIYTFYGAIEWSLDDMVKTLTEPADA